MFPGYFSTFKYFLIAITTIIPSKIGYSVADASKITFDVLDDLNSGKFQNIIVECRENTRASAELDAILDEISAHVATTNTRISGGTRLTELVNVFQTVSMLVMDPVTSFLYPLGVPFEPLWIANMILVRDAGPQLILDLANLETVMLIRKEKIIPRSSTSEPAVTRAPLNENVTWNMGLIDARCKKIKCLGLGVRVGVLDSGAIWNHTELIESWIGEKYGWLDATNETSGALPYDNFGHGTHVTATIVGKTVGVAPQAKWSACRDGNYEDQEAAILLCAQYFACPWLGSDTSLNRVTKNCSARVHIVNNSWGGDGGSQKFDFYNHVLYKMVKFWNAVGIVSFFAMGNSGPSCGSGIYPAIGDIVTAVGSIDRTKTISAFSSRGPAIMTTSPSVNTTAHWQKLVPTPDPNCVNASAQGKPVYLLTKPDIVAPGNPIYSAWIGSTTDYISISGTSMATPHVSGVAALVICTNINKSWDYKELYRILTSTAHTSGINLQGTKTGYNGNEMYVVSSNILCNYLTAHICLKPYPNNMYGYGIVNACDAVIMASIENQVDYPDTVVTDLTDLPETLITDLIDYPVTVLTDVVGGLD